MSEIDPELERWLRESPLGAEFAPALEAIRRLEEERDRMKQLARPAHPWSDPPLESAVFGRGEGRVPQLSGEPRTQQPVPAKSLRLRIVA